MFTARSFFATVTSGTVFQVADFSGTVIFTTRHADVAVRVAARCNSGDCRVFSTDFSGD